MQKGFLDLKIILGIAVVAILIAGVIGAVYLSKQRTQIKSQAAFACSCAPNADYGDPANKAQWCGCAAQCNDAGSLISGQCPQAPTQATCQSDCSKCTIGSDKCGNTTYDSCDYSTCTSPGATYKCKASGNNNCQGSYACGSACVVAATASTCPVTASCCSVPLQKCGTGTTFNAATGKDTSCPAGFQWCNGNYCVSEKYNPDTRSCASVCSKDDFGDGKDKESWCACAKRFASDYITSPTYGGCAGNTAAVSTVLADQSTDAGDGATCRLEIVDDSLKPNPPVTSGKTYRAKVYMTNTGTNSWNKGTYKLGTQNMSMWGVKDVYGITSAESKSPNDIRPGNRASFEIPITAPVVTRFETYPMYFVMKNAQDKWFGAACEPQEVQVQPEIVGLTTACYAISENQADISSITKCDDKTKVSSYTKDPTTLPYSFKDTTPGLKTLYVRFISNKGDIKDANRQIMFTPDPVIDTIVCTRSSTGQGTLIGVRGQSFGAHTQQGGGYIKVNGESTTIVSWDEGKNVVVSSTPKLLEGVSTVDFKTDNGKLVSGTCNLGVSTVSFDLSTQCSPKGAFSSPTVDVRLQEATSGAKPFYSKSLSASKGVVQGFEARVESGKKYSLLIKAAKTLVKKIDFVADEGTKNLGNIKLWIGDIAPKAAPDGQINVFDKSEMVNQWSVLETKTLRSADLNGDGTVNNHDYSCQKLGIGQQNEASMDGI